jgi:ribose 5-phosphate isomerase B
MAKTLITERDILELIKKGVRRIMVTSETLITPSAKDAAARHKIEFVEGTAATPVNQAGVNSIMSSPGNKNSTGQNRFVVAIGSDHGGYTLKEVLKLQLADWGYPTTDVGTQSENACDYPDFAFAVASLVSSGQASRGIMIDGVGVASAIVANKVPGIRAVSCTDDFTARSSREHNDANVLTLGGRVIGTELAKAIVKVWLETEFVAGRHQARVSKIADVEKRYTQKG